MGFEEQMDIRRLQKDLEKLTAKVAELEAKVITSNTFVMGSCQHYWISQATGAAPRQCIKCGEWEK